MKKILKTSLTREEQSKKLVNDILILRQLDHPNILKIFEFYQDTDYFYVVSEFCKVRRASSSPSVSCDPYPGDAETSFSVMTVQ